MDLFKSGVERGFMIEYPFSGSFQIINSEKFQKYILDCFNELEDCNDYYSSGLAYGKLYYENKEHLSEKELKRYNIIKELYEKKNCFSIV